MRDRLFQSRFRLLLIFMAVWSVLSASPAHSNGVLEINQACALNGGCFPGDTAGFPVDITVPGSYVLTSNLDLSAVPDTNGIFIAADMVTLDLGGFVITGDATCTGSGATLSCSTGAGSGISAVSPVVGLTIRNGVVRNMGRFGIFAGAPGVRLDNITVRNNGNTGIRTGESALVLNSIANENGMKGFDVGNESVLSVCTSRGNGGDGIELGQSSSIEQCTSFGNGESGFVLGLRSKFDQSNRSRFNVSEDDCAGGICTSRTRFYVTRSSVAADAALQACTPGFRMANFYELVDPSQLQYDVVLGNPLGTPDGTPQSGTIGWVRNGSQFDTGNCAMWTSTNNGDTGMTAELDPNASTAAGTGGSPWTTSFPNCDTMEPVWCIEEN